MSLFISPIIRATDANNNALSGARWYFYRSGTLVPAETYTTSDRDTPHANPVVADSGGLFPAIYLDPLVTYRAILQTAGGVEIDDVDPYVVSGSSASPVVSIDDFGAVADCTAVGVGTDNAAAINAAIAAAGAAGAAVLIPKNLLGYRVASPLVFTEGVKLIGQGWHENPGTVDGTVYPIPQNWRGSILVFDQNIAGLRFIGYTDNNADATSLEYESSSYSIVEDLAIYGGGGTTVTAHGIESRVNINLRNVRVENFAGNGVYVQATTAGAVPWGNANNANFTRVLSRGNKCHGWHIEGSDSNVVTLINCDGSLNGGVGFLDESLIGNNVYLACHAATNNQSHGDVSNARTKVVADWAGLSDANAGSFVQVGGPANLYLSCYAEIGEGMKGEILTPSIVIGGILAETGTRTASWTASVWGGSGNTGLTIATLLASAGLAISHGAGSAVDIANAAGGTALVRLRPGTGTFSNLQLAGNANSIALGLDIISGSGAANFSADSFVFRNAAQSANAFTADDTGIDLPSGNTLKVAGTQVVGARGAAVADATDAATAISQLNALLARLRTHGLIAT
jgi:hypothetical protein